MIHVHVSDIRQYKTCRIRWHFTSPLSHGREMPPEQTPRALSTGWLVHKALEIFYSNDRDMLVAWKTVEQIMKDQTEDGHDLIEPEALKYLLAAYATWSHANNTLKVIDIEKEFSVPLSVGVDLAGRFDMIVEGSEGDLWVHDFKTMSRDPQDFLDYIGRADDQARAYVYALKQLYPERPVGGIIYTLIRTGGINLPEVLSSGKYSKNVAKTSYAVAWPFFKARGLTEDYADFLEKLQQKEWENPTFLRATFSFTKEQLYWWKEHVKPIVEEMSTPSDVPYSPANPFTCMGCAFKEPCKIAVNFGVNEAITYLNTYAATTSQYSEQARLFAEQEAVK